MSTFYFFVWGVVSMCVCFVYFSLHLLVCRLSFSLSLRLLYNSLYSSSLFCLFRCVIPFIFVFHSFAFLLLYIFFFDVAMSRIYIYVYIRYEFCGEYCNLALHAFVLGIRSNLVPLKHCVYYSLSLIRSFCFRFFFFFLLFCFFASLHKFTFSFLHFFLSPSFVCVWNILEDGILGWCKTKRLHSLKCHRKHLHYRTAYKIYSKSKWAKKMLENLCNHMELYWVDSALFLVKDDADCTLPFMICFIDSCICMSTMNLLQSTITTTWIYLFVWHAAQYIRFDAIKSSRKMLKKHEGRIKNKNCLMEIISQASTRLLFLMLRQLLLSSTFFFTVF